MMRRLALAVLLLLAGPGFASAQCGYTDYAVGTPYACGVAESDGFVDCWGFDPGGLFAAVPASTGASDIAVGQQLGCIVKSSDSTLECWDITGSAVDTEPGGTFTAVACGSSSCCAITTGGGIDCWGSGEASFDEAAPGSGTFTQISGAEDVYCARENDGSLACWGLDFFASGMISSEPAGAYDMVAAGSFHACAIKTSDDSITCWGENGGGESTPPAGTFLDVAVGDTQSCAITTGAGVECWGADNSGLYYGTQPTNCDYVSIESYQSTNFCVRDTENNISCWGWDEETTTEDPDSCPITPTTCPEPGAAGSYCVTSVGM